MPALVVSACIVQLMKTCFGRPLVVLLLIVAAAAMMMQASQCLLTSSSALNDSRMGLFYFSQAPDWLVMLSLQAIEVRRRLGSFKSTTRAKFTQ